MWYAAREATCWGGGVYNVMGRSFVGADLCLTALHQALGSLSCGCTWRASQPQEVHT